MGVLLVSVLLSVCPWLPTAFSEETLQLPSYIDVCYRDDPEVAECLKKEIQKLVPLFKSGSREFDLASLDPLVIRKIMYSFKNALIGGRIIVPNAVIKDLSQLQVLDVRPKVNIPNKFILDIDVHLSHMNVKANYSMKGNVILVPVNMRGLLNFDLHNVNLTYHIDGDVEKRDDRDYLMLKSFNWKFKGEGIERLNLINNNVVEGRPTLNRIVVTIIRNSWRQLKDSILPAVLPEADKALTEMFIKFFNKYPYDILFPKKKREEAMDDSL